jgi:hypothetical protein
MGNFYEGKKEVVIEQIPNQIKGEALAQVCVSQASTSGL